MLLASEALVVVALALEQLLKVRFAVEFAVKGSKRAKAAETKERVKDGGGRERERGRAAFIPEFGVTVFAAEAGGMEDQVVGHQLLHGIDGLLTRFTGFLFHLKAERLSTHADSTQM